MPPPAHCIYQVFEPGPTVELLFDRHYLLYAAQGTIRLEAAGRRWTLPPTRAAWLKAGEPIRADIARPITCCSALFEPDWITAPADVVTVFEMSVLAREMILACRVWGPDWSGDDSYGLEMFRALSSTCLKAAEAPTNTWMPTGSSQIVRNALDFTEEKLIENITFGDVASAAATSERSLARRFADETGMTWRQAQRRLRMIRAVEALTHTSDTVTEVALSTGYNALSAFNAAFLEFSGETPTEYRKRIRTSRPVAKGA